MWCKSCSLLSVSCLVGLLSYLIIFESKRDIEYAQLPGEDFAALALNYSISDLANNGFPVCRRPMVIRNAIEFPDNNACIEQDNCKTFIKNRFYSYFKDRIITYYNSDEREGLKNKRFTKFSNFLNDSKYGQDSMIAVHQLATQLEMNDFLSFEEHNSKDIFHNLMNMGSNNNNSNKISDYFYCGTNWFITHLKDTGSPLHSAWANNVFIVLSGIKHWLLVKPEYFDQLGCKLNPSGVYGFCNDSNEFIHNTFGHTNVTKLKNYLLYEQNIPKEDIIDVILYPGDVLINCHLWLHSITNEDSFTTAMSMRIIEPLNDLLSLFLSDSIYLRMVFNSMLRAIKTTYGKSSFDSKNGVTFLKGLFNSSVSKGFADTVEKYNFTLQYVNGNIKLDNE